MVKNKIGERIKFIREKADQNQKDFARTMGVTPATINRYEKGHRIPDADFLKKVVSKYSCDSAWLLTGSNDPERTPELKSYNLGNLDPEIDEIVNWLLEVPEARPLFVRFIKAYRELDSAADEIKRLGISNIKKFK